MFELVPAPLPFILRLLLAVSLVLGVGTGVAMMADGDPLGIIVFLALASVPVWFRTRRRMRVVAFSDRLVVHNGKREHLIERSEIAGFEISTSSLRDVRKEGGIVGPAVYAVGHAGWSVPLQVTAEKVGRSPLSASLGHLEEWLGAGR